MVPVPFSHAAAASVHLRGRIEAVIEERIRRFIEDPASGDFNQLAKEAFAFQYEKVEAYRKLCDQNGTDPANVDDWRQIPPIPALAFKSLDLATVEGGEVFRSSGTTGDQQSVHRHGFLDLYRATIDRTIPAAVLGEMEHLPILSLIPDRAMSPDSSLSFMADHIIRQWGTPQSVNAFGSRGVDFRLARSFFSARQRDGQPVLILSTSFALDQLVESLAKLDLRFRLPAGTVVFETGGYKGRRREVARSELLASLQERLAVVPDHVVREYGMTELTSQLYTGIRQGGDQDLFLAPEWVKTRVLDPETLDETTMGTAGLICIFDLANLSSAVHLLTEDLGIMHDNGLLLTGRAAGADLRGCSLTVEDLWR